MLTQIARNFLRHRPNRMTSTRRILDANANRAREALRVMEEAARFLLDDVNLSESLKTLRHDLAAALAVLGDLTPWRETPGDVGITITHPREHQRQSTAAVTVAAGKRLSEALRALEEYGKTVDPNFACRIEALRYRGYDLEQKLNRAMPTARREQWRLCVLVSEALCSHGNWAFVAQACIEAGVDAVQLREKNLDARELLGRATDLVAMARGSGTRIIINDRPDIALASGAHGVHLGQCDLSPAAARKIVGHDLLIGASTSKFAEAKQALADGANYCGLGPMFPTTTKHKPRIAGPAYLRQYMQWNRLPHLAIGGITPDNLPQLLDAGVQGIAVSSCVCQAESPNAVVKTLIEVLNKQYTKTNSPPSC